jgi:hypothetical protein
LRLEGPVKTSHRLVKRPTVLGGVELAPGTHVALMNGAIHRDPRRFEDPNAFRLDRPKAKEHIGFGRGAHTCPGAPLARHPRHAVSLTRLLARMGDIRVSDEHPRAAGARLSQTMNRTYILSCAARPSSGWNITAHTTVSARLVSPVDAGSRRRISVSAMEACLPGLWTNVT